MIKNGEKIESRTNEGKTARTRTGVGMHNKALGAWGEAQVEQWYLKRGYDILDTNWRCRDGELDLIVARGKDLVFCEVKTRSSMRFGHPAEHVDHNKQRRIRGLAVQWMHEHSTRGHVRFDVAAVCGSEIDVCKDAF